MIKESQILEEVRLLREELGIHNVEKQNEDSPLMKKRKTTKPETVKRWERDFNKCNPLDEDDKPLLRALDVQLPKGGILVSQRGKTLEELTIVELEFWAIRNEEDVRRWAINIPASIVLANRLSKLWKEQGDNDYDIESMLKSEENPDNKFPSATYIDDGLS